MYRLRLGLFWILCFKKIIMLFEDIYGNEPQKDYLKNAVMENRVGHSYIFSGIEGIGKKKFALMFSALINCTTGNLIKTGKCDCTSCRKISKLIHPDVTLLEYPEEKNIKVEQIRKDIEERIYLSPFESKFKIFIVDDAERMNFNAQNAFLKTLEEPPSYSVIILITSSINFIVPTIRSRCQIVNFKGLSGEAIKSTLTEKGGLTPEEADIALRLSGGSIGRAVSLNSEQLNFRKELITRLLDISPHEPSKISELYEFTGIDKKNGQGNIKNVLDIISYCLRDLVLLKLNAGPDQIINTDLHGKLKKHAEEKTIDMLLRNIEQLGDTWYAVSRLNNNKRLALEDLFIKLSA